MIQCYEAEKFFDKEQIEDAVLVCQKRGADLKAVRLWFKLNDDTKIRVKSGSTMSDVGEVGPVVGQGAIGAALVSQAVLDDGVSEHFPPGGDLQLQYGSVPLAPLIFQDDLINGSAGLHCRNEQKSQCSNERAWAFSKYRQVCFLDFW